MIIYQILSGILVLLPCSLASSTFPSLKFETFFREYSQHFKYSSTIACNTSLQQYLRNDSWVQNESANSLIAQHADCIMANTTETIKFHMARAGVILGLMPTLLSNFGPTPAESSLLMLERPILAVLLAVGSPAMYLSRPFDNYEPLEPLSRPSIRFPAALMTSRAFPVVNIVRYFLATSAAANVITVSLELGRKTVMVWKKPNSYLPLTWALLPVAGHICATIRLWNSLEKVCGLYGNNVQTLICLHSSRLQEDFQNHLKQSTRSLSVLS